MTITEIYNLGLKMGIAADPRGKVGVKKWLKREEKKYAKLSKDDQALFDAERLTNPYADSRLHYNIAGKKVTTIAAGIDIEEAEIALISSQQTDYRLQQIKMLNSRSPKSVDRQPSADVDLIITHHPVGKALAALDEVMHLQSDLMAAYGVPINVAEGVMRERILQVNRSVAPLNHSRAIDAARLVGIPYLNLHTPMDNLVYQFLENLMQNPPAGGQPETLGEIIDLLKTVPEYKEATKNAAGPMIFAGASDNSAGKIIAFDITGGTSGAKEIYPELVKAGVGTVIGMHMKDESRDEAIKNHLNVIIAGHISSDSLGLNLFLDELEKQGIKILPLGGLIRVKRT